MNKRFITFALLALVVCFGSAWRRKAQSAWRIADGGFSPLDIANCELWLDASDNSTVTTNASGSVTTWADKSTGAYNATQVGADTTLPLYCSEQQNGLCTIYFDGGDYLGTSYKTTAAQTIFAVSRSMDTGVDRYLCGARDSTNQRSALRVTQDKIAAGVGAQTTANIFYNTTITGYVSGALIYDGSTVQLRLSGSEVYNAAQSGTGANTTYGLAIGCFNSASTYFAFANSYIAEMIVYSRKLNSTEIAQVETYLTDKWGL
jgi:hypothetical protein